MDDWMTVTLSSWDIVSGGWRKFHASRSTRPEQSSSRTSPAQQRKASDNCSNY